MAIQGYLVDTSAFSRVRLETVRAVVEPLVQAGSVFTCAILDLEALYSAQSGQEYEKIADYRNVVLKYIDTEQADLDRAQQIQAELASQGRHRGRSLPDLIISALAERHNLEVLHYDHDYDLISEVAALAARWVVPRGSIT